VIFLLITFISTMSMSYQSQILKLSFSISFLFGL